MDDMISKNRHPFGDRNGRRTKPERTARGERAGKSKLTEAQVYEIRRLVKEGVSQRVLAKRFGIAHPQIHYIKVRKTWAHLPDISPQSQPQ